MIHIGFLRHGPTAWNREGRIQGRSDIPLDSAALSELENLSAPDEWSHCDVWSSPLCRASQTANTVTGRAPRISDALIEMDWGQWEGQRGQDLIADQNSDFRHIEDWGWDYRPPGGESPADVRGRLLGWANTLEKDALAVCHIGMIRVALALAHGWDFSGPAPFRVKRRRIYALGFENGVFSFLSETRLINRDPGS